MEFFKQSGIDTGAGSGIGAGIANAALRGARPRRSTDIEAAIVRLGFAVSEVALLNESRVITGRGMASGYDNSRLEVRPNPVANALQWALFNLKIGRLCTLLTAI